MKKLTIAALVAGQILASAQPCSGAEFVETRAQQMSAFAGVRLRVPLDGNLRQRPSATLTVAPAMYSRTLSGASDLRIGSGLDLGITGRRATVALAGVPVHRLGAAQDEDEAGSENRGRGPSTLGWIAIGAGALLVVGAGVGYLVLDEALDCDPGDDCS